MINHVEFLDKLECILERDDKESFVKLFHEYPGQVGPYLAKHCAHFEATECMIELMRGELWEALEDPATCLIYVLHYLCNPYAKRFREVKAAFEDRRFTFMKKPDDDRDLTYEMLNMPCTHFYSTSLHVVLDGLSAGVPLHLHSLSQGDSIFKVILLLCMCETKQHLDALRRFAKHTSWVNDIAWTYLQNGKLMQVAALLLVDREGIMFPFETGMTIQQRLTNRIDELNHEVDLGREGGQYKSMLMEASKLFDVFQRAGDALSNYCIMMDEYVAPEKVMVDVVNVLKKAGFLLQCYNIGVQDWYRGDLELSMDNLFKVSDTKPERKYYLNPYPTRIRGSFTAPGNLSLRHPDPVLDRLRSKETRIFASNAPQARLLSTVSSQIDRACVVSSVPVKHLAYVALKLKRGIRFI